MADIQTPLFVDPKLEFVFINRLLFSLDNPRLWDREVMPRQNKYVIFGQSTCQKKEALVHLLEKHEISYHVRKLEQNKTAHNPYNPEPQVIVVENGQYLPSQADEIGDDKYIYVVLNDLPPNNRKNSMMFWKEKFDYRLSYNTPDTITAKKMFMNQVKKFNSDKIILDDAGFDILARAAEFCTFKDIQVFCRKKNG